MVKPFPLIIPFPLIARGIEQVYGANYVRLDEGHRLCNGAINMAFGGQMEDAFNRLLVEEIINGLLITNIHSDESVIGSFLDFSQVFENSGIREGIEVNNLIIRIFVYK